MSYTPLEIDQYIRSRIRPRYRRMGLLDDIAQEVWSVCLEQSTIPTDRLISRVSTSIRRQHAPLRIDPANRRAALASPPDTEWGDALDRILSACPPDLVPTLRAVAHAPSQAEAARQLGISRAGLVKRLEKIRRLAR